MRLERRFANLLVLPEWTLKAPKNVRCECVSDQGCSETGGFVNKPPREPSATREAFVLLE